MYSRSKELPQLDSEGSKRVLELKEAKVEQGTESPPCAEFKKV